MRNTVADPSYITADASKSRLDLAFDAGVLETGLDAAETIEARNSLEPFREVSIPDQHVQARRRSMRRIIARRTNAAALRA